MNNNKNGFLARLLGGLLGKGRLNASESNATTARPDAQPQTPPRGLPQAPQPSSPAPVSSAASGATPQPAERERVVRVFISSTFKDMIEDRNTLMAQTWPALRKLCRERSVEFVEVDLRWGITEEQSKRKETVQYCLDEIRRCRPYFIGLLGERYGWVPEAEAFPEPLLEREGWLKPEIARRSATELEILHGVLNDPTMAGRAFFYFRDPAFSERLAAAGEPQMVEGSEPQEVEKHGAAEAARRAQWRRERLADLKGRIRTLCQERGMPLRDADRYADPEALAALVLEDLTAAIDAEFPADRVPDVWAREARDHEAYAQSRRSPYYIGRDAYFQRLDAYARDGADNCGLTVLGESGAGKSALLANWLGRWREAHPGAFVFQHYIGSSPMSAGHLALMRRLMVAIVRWCAEPGTPTGFGSEEERIPAQSEEIVKVFPEYLGRLAYQARQRGVPALIVLDALNQIEDRERGRLLGWLPYRFPLDLRLLVSTLPSETLEALGPRGWPSLTVEPLGAAERTELIARYLSHHSRGLSEARTRAIAQAPACANPLYLKSLLDDLRATGVNRRLDAQIGNYLQAPDIPALLVKVLARYEHDYERDRPGLVREALSLIWAARRGLTEAEVLHLLKPKDLPQLPLAVWTPLRLAMEEGLVDRGGILGFGHDFLRAAVEAAYVPDAAVAKTLRLRLADDFEAQAVSARNCDELPWLLRQVEARTRLRNCLLDIDQFLEINRRDQDELMRYWVWLGEERIMGPPYFSSFKRWCGVKHDVHTARFPVGHKLGYFLAEAAIYTEAETLFRHALSEATRWLGPQHTASAVIMRSLAELLQRMHRYPEAISLYERSLSVLEANYGEHPAVATLLNNLALLLRASNRLTEATTLSQRALDIDRQVYGLQHPHVARDLNTVAGNLQALNKLKEAESIYQDALSIIRVSYGEEHPLVGTALNNLAEIMRMQNRNFQAEPLLRRALLIAEQSYGIQHPAVAVALNNLAELLRIENRLAEAEPLYRRSLQIDECIYDPEHPRIAADLNNLALLLNGTQRYAEAEPLIRQSLSINEKAQGSNSPECGTTLDNLGAILQVTNRPVEAEACFRRALAIAETMYPPDHPKVGVKLNNYANLLSGLGRHAEAENYSRRALVIFEGCNRANDPDVATCLNSLAGALRALKRGKEAEPLRRRATTILLNNANPNGQPHPNLGLYIANYLALLVDNHSLEDALSIVSSLGPMAEEALLNELYLESPELFRYARQHLGKSSG